MLGRIWHNRTQFWYSKTILIFLYDFEILNFEKVMKIGT